MSFQRTDTEESPDHPSFELNISPSPRGIWGKSGLFKNIEPLLPKAQKEVEFPTLKQDFVEFSKNIVDYVGLFENVSVVDDTIQKLDWFAKSALFAYIMIHRKHIRNETKLIEQLYSNKDTDFTLVPNISRIPGTMHKEAHVFKIRSEHHQMELQRLIRDNYANQILTLSALFDNGGISKGKRLHEKYDISIFLAPLHYYRSICRPTLTLTSSYAAAVTGEKLNPDKESWWFPFEAISERSELVVKLLSHQTKRKSKGPIVPHSIVIAALSYRMQGISRLENDFGFLKKKNSMLLSSFRKFNRRNHKPTNIFEELVLSQLEISYLLLLRNCNKPVKLAQIPMFIKLIISARIRKIIDYQQLSAWFCLSIAQLQADNKGVVFDLSNLLKIVCMTGDIWNFHFLLNFMKSYVLAVNKVRTDILPHNYINHHILFDSFSFDLKQIKLRKARRISDVSDDISRAEPNRQIFGPVKIKDSVEHFYVPSNCLVAAIITGEFKIAKIIVETLTVDRKFSVRDFLGFEQEIQSFINSLPTSIEFCCKHIQINTVSDDKGFKSRQWFEQQCYWILHYFQSKFTVVSKLS